MNECEAAQLAAMIDKNTVCPAETVVIDMGDVHIIRLDRDDSTQYVTSPRDWAKIAMREVSSESL